MIGSCGFPRRTLRAAGSAASTRRAKINRNTFGCLVSVPGIVDEKHGRVLFSPNLHWTESANLAELIQGVWDAPVI